MAQEKRTDFLKEINFSECIPFVTRMNYCYFGENANWLSKRARAPVSKEDQMFVSGHILLEFFTKKPSFIDCRIQDIPKDCKKEIPDDCPQQYKDLIETCWLPEANRPSFEKFLSQLRLLDIPNSEGLVHYFSNMDQLKPCDQNKLIEINAYLKELLKDFCEDHFDISASQPIEQIITRIKQQYSAIATPLHELLGWILVGNHPNPLYLQINVNKMHTHYLWTEEGKKNTHSLLFHHIEITARYWLDFYLRSPKDREYSDKIPTALKRINLKFENYKEQLSKSKSLAEKNAVIINVSIFLQSLFNKPSVKDFILEQSASPVTENQFFPKSLIEPDRTLEESSSKIMSQDSFGK